MKIGFTTLGCPGWDLDTICRRGREYGYDGVDFRGYLETLDVTTSPLFTTGVAEVRRKLGDAGLEVSGISSSIRVCEEARRTIALAGELGAANIRVFDESHRRDHRRRAGTQDPAASHQDREAATRSGSRLLGLI